MVDLISPLNLGIGPEKRGKEKTSNRIGANASIGHRRHGMGKEAKEGKGSPTQNATKANAIWTQVFSVRKMMVKLGITEIG